MRLLDRYIVPEYRGKFEGAIRSAQNFFKHSDRDGPDATLEFDPHFTELMISATWTVAPVSEGGKAHAPSASRPLKAQAHRTPQLRNANANATDTAHTTIHPVRDRP